MAQSPLRVGFIGIGGIGAGHARAAAQHPNMEVAAFLDVKDEFLERASRQHPQAAVCKTLEQFLATPKLDAAVVATPNSMHAEYTIACAQKGLHVLCEKPLAMTVAEAEPMVQAVKSRSLVGLTNFSYRWVESFRLMRETVKSGAFGRVFRLHVKYLQSFLRDPNSPLVWRNRVEIAGFGALGDLGSHMIDAARFITGAEPRRVIGVKNTHVADKLDPKTGGRAPVTTDTDAQFMVDFGAFVGIFETSQVEPAHGNHLVVSFGGENGSARVYSEDGKRFELALGEPYANYPTWKTCLPWVDVPTTKQLNLKSGRGCIDDFYSAIRDGLADYPSFEDGLAAQKVLNGILESERTKAWVEF